MCLTDGWLNYSAITALCRFFIVTQQEELTLFSWFRLAMNAKLDRSSRKTFPRNYEYEQIFLTKKESLYDTGFAVPRAFRWHSSILVSNRSLGKNGSLQKAIIISLVFPSARTERQIIDPVCHSRVINFHSSHCLSWHLCSSEDHNSLYFRDDNKVGYFSPSITTLSAWPIYAVQYNIIAIYFIKLTVTIREIFIRQIYLTLVVQKATF